MLLQSGTTENSRFIDRVDLGTFFGCYWKESIFDVKQQRECNRHLRKRFLSKRDFYRVGDIDIQYGIICWRGKEEKLSNHCTKVSVSLNNAGTAVFSFTQMGSYSFAVGFFGIDAPKIQQCTLDFDAVSRNKHTAVALNQHGHVISTWNKLNDAIILTGRQYKTSPIKEFKVNLDRLTHTNRNIQHMSIALNDKNTVVFAYHTTSGFIDRKKAVYTSLRKLERY